MTSKDISSYFAKPAAKATTSSAPSKSNPKSKSELESSSNGTKRSPETSPSGGSKKSNLPKAMQEAILEGVRDAKRTKLDTPAKTAPIFAAASASGAKSSTEKITLPKVSSKKELSELLSTHEHKKELLQLELDTLGEDWLLALQDEFTKPYFLTLKEFVTKEQQTKKVFPPAEDIYSWSRILPLKDVRVVIVGQDPYHDDGQAHGFAFSVRKGMRIPPSLRNIYKELAEEIPEFKIPQHGDLTEWAKHGVLLLNTSLTVRAHEAGSHSNRGWETFTAAVLKVITSRLTPNPNPAISSSASGPDPDPDSDAKSEPKTKPDGKSGGKKEDGHVPGAQGVVFMAWGKHAQTMCTGVDKKKHLVLQSAHPSPFAAAKGFFGNGHFVKANEWLEARYGPKGGIDWAVLGPK